MLKRKLTYSRHAKRQMKWREISHDEVQKVILSHSRTEPSIKGRTNYWGKIRDKWLKVTVIEEPGKITVVPAIWKGKTNED